MHLSIHWKLYDACHQMYIFLLMLPEIFIIVHIIFFTSAGSVYNPVPTLGTVLVDLSPDDPEYISVDEQVQLTFHIYL